MPSTVSGLKWGSLGVASHGRFVDCQCVLGRAREAYQHSGTEAVRPVASATIGDELNRETGPLRELLLKPAAHRLRCGGLRNSSGGGVESTESVRREGERQPSGLPVSTGA